MATTIKLKNGSGAPLAGDLVQGEPALDLTNKRLYTEDSGGSVIEVGTNPTSLTTGTFTSTGIDDNATSTAITIDASQNVGIGLSPASKLHVGNFASEGSVPALGANGGAFSFTAGADAFGLIGGVLNTGASYLQSQTTDGTTTAYNLLLNPNGGNVGISTSSPATKLNLGGSADQTIQVNGSGTAGYLGTSTSVAQISSNRNPTTGTIYDSGRAVSYINLEALSGNSNIQFFTSTTNNTNPTERMRIDSSGNVGIGKTPSSYNLLEVNGDISTEWGASPTNIGMKYFDGSQYYLGLTLVDSGRQTRVVSKSADNTGYIAFDTGSSATERMRINASGDVLVGPSTVGQASLELKVNGSSYAEIEAINFGLNYNMPLVLQRQGGNVGIGTATPNSKLHTTGSLTVNDKIYLQRNSSSLILPIASYWDGSGSPLSGAKGDIVAIGNSGGDGLVFANSNLERMRIDSGGNVLVGTTSAVSGTNPAKQYIFSNTASQSCFQVTAGSSHTGIYGLGAFSTVASASGSNVALVVQSGNGSTVTANNFYVYTNGDVKNTNNSYTGFSDARLKENIVDASPQLDDIMAMRVRSYNLKSTGAKHIGVIAQELEETSPELVTTDEEGMKSVKYSIMYMKAIKALQEAVTRIETLEAEVAALKGA